jgi:23S rRNA pseudouridine955/2504/2580 synthase
MKSINHIRVLFENDECVVLDKPAGLPVQGGEGVGLSLDAVLRSPAGRFEPDIHLAGDTQLLLVHRLDKDTSGVLLAAKGRAAAAKFAALFSSGGKRDRAVRKRYLAVCAGRPVPDAGVIKTSLDVRGSSRAAETGYALLKSGPLPADGAGEEGEGRVFSVLELEPGTGRMHQIRRHLRQIGCPILGDDKYGDFALNRTLRRKGTVKRLLLHASRLSIPAAGIDVSAPPPECFAVFV